MPELNDFRPRLFDFESPFFRCRDKIDASSTKATDYFTFSIRISFENIQTKCSIKHPRRYDEIRIGTSEFLMKQCLSGLLAFIYQVISLELEACARSHTKRRCFIYFLSESLVFTRNSRHFRVLTLFVSFVVSIFPPSSSSSTKKSSMH